MPADNPVLRAITARRSVRSYEDRPVPREAVEAMLRAAMAAPSAKNAQPWVFQVVSERKTLDQMAEVLQYGKMLAHAPMAIMVGADMKIAEESLPGLDYWVLDCSAAVMNLLLAAEAVGLGAVWLGIYPVPDRVENISRILGMPETAKPLCIVAVGYPKGETKAQDKYDATKVHWEQW